MPDKKTLTKHIETLPDLAKKGQFKPDRLDPRTRTKGMTVLAYFIKHGAMGERTPEAFCRSDSVRNLNLPLIPDKVGECISQAKALIKQRP